MKTGIAIVLFTFLTASTKAGSPYRNYLVAKAQSQFYARSNDSSAPVERIIQNNTPALTLIPRYQIPMGAVFCRLEDKLTRATKVWIKIGVK